MSLPDFDTMVKMSSTELDALLESEAEKIILAAPKKDQARYRAVLNGCKLRSQAAKTTEERMIVANEHMWKMLNKLDDLLNDLDKELKK